MRSTQEVRAWRGDLGHPPRFDPARPLRIGHGPGTSTFALVSIAWLRELPESGRADFAARHFADSETRFAATLPVAKRRLEWLAGRFALKCAVRAHQRGRLGLRPDPARTVRIRTVGEGLRAGKPYVDGPFEVGLTHAGDFALAVCAPRPIGVDLEPRRSVTPYLERLLLLDDMADDTGPGRARLRRMPLMLRWACKEAVLKHFGFGLRIGGGVREVELTGWYGDGRFTWRPGPALERHLPADGAERTRCLAREIDGYSLAIVWQA
ncbi:4'-phosphopantetheinyl transferase family protein [Streptomyces sp. NPDC002643]